MIQECIVEAKSQPIVCRPPVAVLVLALLYAAFAVLSVAAQFAPDDGRPLPVVLRVFLGLFTITASVLSPLQLLSFFRHRVIAGDEGIRWRNTWGNWRSATWAEVQDYYHAPSYDFQKGTEVLTSVVVTAQGTVRLSPNIPRETQQAFQERVQKEATAARVQDWALLGIRRVDPFPRVFRYWDHTQWWRLALFVAVTATLYTLAAIGSTRLIAYFAQYLSPSDMQSIYKALVAAFLVGSIIPGFFIRDFIVRWKRRHERFTVTPETFRYDAGKADETREVPWSQITDYFYQSGSARHASRFTLVLHGSDEQQVSWSPLLPAYPYLLAMIHRYAPRPAHQEQQWRSQGASVSANGSDPTTWTGGAVGVGHRVFHYKTTIMAMFLFSLLLMDAIVAIACISEWQKAVSAGKWFALWTTLFLLLSTVWAFLSYFRLRIEVDDLGITKHDVFSRKHLYWYAVEGYKVTRYSASSTSGYVTVVGKNGVSFSFDTMFNGYNELATEIERYASPLKKSVSHRPDTDDSA